MDDWGGKPTYFRKHPYLLWSFQDLLEMFQSWTQVVDGSPYITDDGEVLQTLGGPGKEVVRVRTGMFVLNWFEGNLPKLGGGNSNII